MLFNATTLMWPFTLDYAMNRSSCVNCNGSVGPFEALWQFPLHEWTYPNGEKRHASITILTPLSSSH